MFDFMEIVSDVVKTLTFQTNRPPGRKRPTRRQHADWPASGYDWNEPIRRGRR